MSTTRIDRRFAALKDEGLAAALNRWQVTFRDRNLLVLQAWEAPTLRYQLLLEPGAGGEQRGRVAFFAGMREVASLPVYAR